MKRAMGSFGLCVNCSLDAHRQVTTPPPPPLFLAPSTPCSPNSVPLPWVSQVVIAARGQTMSIAFYPTMGLVSYGSEAAATKAPLVIVPAHHRARLELFFKRNDPQNISKVLAQCLFFFQLLLIASGFVSSALSAGGKAAGHVRRGGAGTVGAHPGPLPGRRHPDRRRGQRGRRGRRGQRGRPRGADSHTHTH